jgi:phytoene dehydrogenase-like protein
VPAGGAGRLTEALAARARAAGAQVLTNERVERVVVRQGTALGVVTAGGVAVRARRAVLADLPAPTLFGDLVERSQLPSGLHREFERFQWDLPTVKVNWALNGPVPWRAKEAASAGTVHLGTDVEGLALWSTSLAIGRSPDQDFLLVGQMAQADATRAPAGAESLWSYSHLPRGASVAQADALAARMDELLEAYAPGFRDLVVDRWVQSPAELERTDLALVGGTINGGTAQLHQQLVFRPTIGLGRPETSVDRLLLAGSSAHPGGGVHGAAGYLAARAALSDARFGGATGRALSRINRRLQRPPRHPFP